MKKSLLTLVAGAVLLAVSCSKKSHTASLEKAAAAQEVSIRVMSYNVHHCNPPDKPGVIDIDGIAAVINEQSPDLVALQEIDVNTGRSGSLNQAEELGKKTGMKYFFGKAIDYDGGAYGVAILSKYDIAAPTVHKLPTLAGTNGEPRVLATVKVSLPGGATIRFASTHLDAQRADTNRDLQIKEINRLVSADSLPFVIAGDFNAIPGSSIIEQLDSKFTRSCQNCDPTIPIVNPNKTIDFIAFRPAEKIRAKSTKVLTGIQASDHLPVVAELTLTP
ncbi:endonuclease/exonuclease/phosphatase family protein [Pedobacter sp. SYSU D00535]|uniref:endonuclease/exonuclease/phosphatase family protein n=1 Tax=Pedobacter sp. SYSU D00535 TaxID=2810308 RepID=UPI001A963112|nr:endonuclease/exonuclease/phosphatase family protein [Pedobacter sp. SYSU D00535]